MMKAGRSVFFVNWNPVGKEGVDYTLMSDRTGNSEFRLMHANSPMEMEKFEVNK